MFKNNIKLSYFVLIISVVNLLLYHLPLFKFAVNNLDYKSLDGILTIVNLAVLTIFLNVLFFYILFFISQFIGKLLLVIFFNINAIAIYFIVTYGVIIDETMIGNILNTKFEESSSFFSFGLIMYLILLGVIPSILIIKTKIIKVKFTKFLIHTVLNFIFIVLFVILILAVGYGLITIQKF